MHVNSRGRRVTITTDLHSGGQRDGDIPVGDPTARGM
jgi:hypothetical protein